jgi:hypothetical protein
VIGGLAKVAIGGGLIAMAFGAADQALVARNERDLSVDRVALLQAPAAPTTAFELLSRPALGGSAPWTHNLFVVFASPPDTRNDLVLADIEQGLLTREGQLGWTLDPVASQYTNGWVDLRGTAGPDLVELGSCHAYLSSADSDPDAIALLEQQPECAQSSTVLVHVFANPLPPR